MRALGGGIDAMQLGRLDLPLIVLVAGGRNFPGLDSAQDAGAVHADRLGGLRKGIGHGYCASARVVMRRACAPMVAGGLTAGAAPPPLWRTR
jgi:hypothetical protein